MHIHVHVNTMLPVFSKPFVFCNVACICICHHISQVQYDMESICRCYVASETSYYYYILYYSDKNRVHYYV